MQITTRSKVHRGTLHEMIKNDANKCAKQIEIKSPVTPAPTSLRQQSSEIDNRHAIQKPVNKYNEVDDNDVVTKPLSKMDLIKKFDSKYKQQSDSVDNKQSIRSNYNENQTKNTIPDEIENDENIQNSNNEENSDVDTHSRSSESESTTVAKYNNYNNGNTYGSNGNEVVPPKPLPRTSRNNSVSSLSSEQGISISNPIEEIARPVAKPRTTTTSYKVQHI